MGFCGRGNRGGGDSSEQVEKPSQSQPWSLRFRLPGSRLSCQVSQVPAKVPPLLVLQADAKQGPHPRAASRHGADVLALLLLGALQIALPNAGGGGGGGRGQRGGRGA